MADLPNIQTAQYGDRAALQKLGPVRRTDNPAADVNGMKQMQGGRPPAPDFTSSKFDPVEYAKQFINNGGQQPQQPGELQNLTPQEQAHQQQFNSLGAMYDTALKLLRVASQPGSGPLTKGYAVGMLHNFTQEFHRVRGDTPFFHGV